MTGELVVGLVGAAIGADVLSSVLLELGRAIRAARRRLEQTGAIAMPRFRLVALVLVAGVAVAAACSSGDDSSSDTVPVEGPDLAGDETAEGPITNSGNTENPPAGDVALTTCDGGDYGLTTAGLVITNNSSEPSTYFVTVEFVAGGVRYGEGFASSSAVAPGQQVELDALGADDLRPDTTCNVTQVERFAS